MKFLFFLLLTLQSIFISFGQSVLYQNLLHGGVTGNGGSTGYTPGTINFNIQIPPGSIIEKAFLIVTEEGKSKSDIIIDLNGISYVFNTSTRYTNEFTTTQTNTHNYLNSSIHVKDITTDINPNTTTYILTKPVQTNLSFGYFKDTYLYVVFRNINLPLINTLIILNNQDVSPFTNYNISNLNPINNNNPVGLEIITADFCDTISDGSYIKINNSLIGLIGGSDITSSITCSSPFPSFAYYNNTLFGLGDDTPNNSMLGTDATADIATYINNNNTSIEIEFEYQNLASTYGPLTNPIRGIILNYTTTCDTFATTLTSDTTICYGETLQLQATGGQAYEWTAISDSSAIDDLSCTDCPNPIFSGDSSTTYTVRIWNTDSCSVVRPIRINVSQPQKLNSYSGESKCGFSNGYIKSINLPDNLDAWYVVTPNNDTLDQNIGNTFTNLGAGDYRVFYIDTIGCKSEDTIVTVNSYINTIADFTVNPSTGSAPLTVQVENQSQNASGFEWFIDGISNGGTPPNLFELSGEYEIGLIAWDTEEYCADTTWRKIVVYDSLIAQIPNVFTANMDGVNDFFGITVNFPVETELMILNRWGNVVFDWKGKLEKGQNNLWKGESKNGDKVSDGVYFYRIEFSQMEWIEKERKVSGYVHVIGR
jgi:gliding motility-associated-like protein